MEKNGLHLFSEKKINFVGSGGSLAVATTLSYISKYEKNNYSTSMTPFDYVLLGKEKEIVVLISASGTNPDINAAFKRALDLNSEKIYLITSNAHAKITQ